MAKKKQFSAKLRDQVLMIGYNEKGQSVYTAFMSVHQYYDGDHPWDDAKKINELSLKTVHGYIFNDAGSLEQEFESHFNLTTGIFENGWQRDEDGTINRA
ncbi:MAG: hypothetical protein MPW14_15420 [Candidatus Manganitrophus sp.]|nr:hypothetical protein [Candidatus Manganitrophus sp.]WDT69798.1 MAG: hypothetical protein MPW17_13550 [Candidatus Manganitrophus sp.]WDT78573.1 MAG: hypothetical protein MPW14_15420 [Candidatus Manganitrophus sp.]